MRPTAADRFLVPGAVPDPHPVYAALREAAPVVPVALPDGARAWLVTRHAEVRAVLADERFVPAARPGTPGTERAGLPTEPSTGVPGAPARAVVARALTDARVERLRGWVGEVADRLVDGFAARGHADLVAEYALPLAAVVVTEIVGVPRPDRAVLAARARTDDPVPAPVHGGAAHRAVRGHLAGLLDRKRHHPGDDLATALLQAPPRERLDRADQLDLLSLVLVAGHGPVVDLVGQAALTLLLHPDQLAAYRCRPWLTDQVVEEVLRFDGPVANLAWRFPAVDLAVGGVPLPAGDAVVCGLAAAARDPRHFLDPDRFDPSHSARWHLAFGHGAHRCPGAALSRLVGVVALERLLARLPDLALVLPADRLARRPGPVARAPRALPVRFGPRG